MADMFENQVKS